MKLTVRLFVQRHENRTYTVGVPLFPTISAYGPTLEECKLEVAEALAARLSEIDPDELHRYAPRPNQRMEKVSVELRPTDRHGKRRRDMLRLNLSLLLTPEEDGQFLVSVPKLRYPPLSFYVAAEGELGEIAQLELSQYFHGEALETIAQYQGARYETLDELEVEFRPKRAVDKQDEEDAESFWALKASGVNLTAQAAEGQLRRAYRRDAQVEQVLAVIASDRRPNVVLAGPSGAGKTAIAYEVARRIRRKECPERLHDRQVWAITGDGLIAGCSYIGQWQEKLADIVREVRKRRHILFVEDVAALAEVGRWSKGDENVADFLKPYLISGDIVLIAESTSVRLRRLEQLTPGFAAQLRVIDVPSAGEADTLSILGALARELERAEQITIDPSALEAAVELTGRFLPYRAQPGKSIALIEQAAGDAGRAAVTGATTRPALTRREVVSGFTRQSGLPEFIISDSLPLDLDAVRAHFADRIIGQPAAVDAVVDLIALVKAGLSDPEKPLGVYLFIGPTGVGKTQLAKTLAGYLFGDEARVLRFDMSEYSDPAAIRRLIGLPGAGREGEGELTRRVRAQPFCVVLLDEFEKADAQIYDVFLQVLGEGRLTDAAGQTTSFQNAIIIMTSNLGAGAREQRGIGLSPARTDGHEQRSDDAGPPSYWQKKVEEYFRPEFVNRIDRIVSFAPLDAQAMRTIASREIGEVLLREGFVRRNVLVDIDPNVVDLLLQQGFTATYGARPLKRAIERLVVLPLARYLAVRGRVGADLLRLRREGDEIVLSAAASGGSQLVGGAPGAEAGTLDTPQLRRARVDDRSLAQGFAEMRRKLQDWDEHDAVVAMRDERATSLAEMNKPTFWDDGDRARATLARFYFLDRLLKRLQQLLDRVAYLEELATLVHRQRDPRYRAELAASYEQLGRDVAFLDIELLCAHLPENHSAIVRLRRVGATPREDGPALPWMLQLAAMYLQWARRKGYEIELFALEPLPEEARRGEGLVTAHYPYRWRRLDTVDMDAAIKQLAKIDEPAELAIGLGGTNVYGFMKGEAGMHRRSDRRPSGERIQRLAEVLVHAPGQQPAELWLDRLVLGRAAEERERAQMTKRQLAALPRPAEAEVVRVYQVEGEHMVRDLRTQTRTTSVSDVLGGQLDEFILAYLRDEEAGKAWSE
jgi:ATP-dependent Clp protease ATP-binding subunit ClpA/predicted RNase H-like HicB family nuclease